MKKKERSKQLIVEALYSDLEDLKQSKSDGEKKKGKKKKKKKRGETESRTPFE